MRIAQILDDERESAERLSGVRVKRAQALLLNGKRPLENQLRLRVSSLMPEQLPKAVQISPCQGMLAPERLLLHGESPPQGHLGPGIIPQPDEQQPEVVQYGRDDQVIRAEVPLPDFDSALE